MKEIKNCLKLLSITFFIILLNFACKNEKVERKLIGDWEVVNSELYLISSNSLVHQSEKLGSIALYKTKLNNSNTNLNEGSWSFQNFPDSIIPALGSLLWTSTDKDNYVKIPWNINIIYSTESIKNPYTQGNEYFNSYQGYFNVTELKKKKHYRLEGDIFKPNYDPVKADNPYYKWVFEIKAK